MLLSIQESCSKETDFNYLFIPIAFIEPLFQIQSLCRCWVCSSEQTYMVFPEQSGGEDSKFVITNCNDHYVGKEPCATERMVGDLH